jgi:AraC family transcriptional regulator
MVLPDLPKLLQSHETLGLARAIARECISWDESSPMVAEGLCLELLAAAQHKAKTRRAGSVPVWLTQAQELLTDQCAEALSMAAVASTVGVHPAHLARNFSRFFKRTPGEHLRRSRVARAAALLLETDLPLVEIGLRCGFADQSHFTNVFKRQKGLSPAAYRSTFKVNRTAV